MAKARRSEDGLIRATSHALLELLILKETIKLSRIDTYSYPQADRKMARVQRKIQRQTIDLASELYGLGVSRSEISSMLTKAKEIAFAREELLSEVPDDSMDLVAQ